MLLKSLAMNNFGVFSGRHCVKLAPRTKYGRKRSIVLFGGLNGAGKTTTLTAVRLALYGRQSMGRGTTVRAYHQQLSEHIHKPRNSIIPPNGADIELSFTYGKHGVVNELKVIRSWVDDGTNVTENLEVFRDDQQLEGLSQDQLQSFLSELIPIGVSDLFFFDGEKIAELAEDDANEALADAIKRLLGLDIIERLRADLGIYLRENTQSKLPKDVSKELVTLGKEYQENYSEYQNFIAQIGDLNTELVSVATEITKTQQRINDLGGAWAKSREAEEIRAEQIIKEKESVINQIKELLADSLPLALAHGSVSKLLEQLQAEKEAKSQIAAKKELSKHVRKLRRELGNSFGESNAEAIDMAISSTFDSLLVDNPTTILHDVSDSEFRRIHTLATSYVPQQVEQMRQLTLRLEVLEGELEAASTNIARAPEQTRLDNILKELGELQAQRGSLTKQIDINKEEAKRALRSAMENLRSLRDLDAKYSKAMSHGQGMRLAANSRAMLSEFAEETKLRKLSILEQEFIKSFSKLARKNDMDIQAKIDPTTFDVNLLDKDGKILNKKRLSAGEKQIFAIAMLEALGRTSGRNLPIIIDTPLGRLDSNHRSNLVKNYFPTASHQVLILSTDTEIDEKFYTELSPEISHAFSVNYDTHKGCSEFNEGYFWRR